MAIHDSGTAVADGDQLNDGYFNGLLDGLPHHKEYSYLPEQYTDASAYVDVPNGSMTISANGGELISIKAQCNLNHSNDTADQLAIVSVILNGTNLGTYSISATNTLYENTAGNIRYGPTLVSGTAATFGNYTNGVRTQVITIPVGLKIVDDTTTLKLAYYASGAGSAFISNIYLKALYSKFRVDD